MKVIVATEETQGQRAGDFCWCTEGELVTIPLEICDVDTAEGPDGRCGCSRSWSGLSTHKGTTTAAVRRLDGLTVDELTAVLRVHLEECDEPGSDLDALAAEHAARLAEVAAGHDPGTVLEIRMGVISPRRPLP